MIADFAEVRLSIGKPALIVAPGCNVGNRALPRATMTTVSQNLSIVLPLRAELWSAYQDTIAEAGNLHVPEHLCLATSSMKLAARIR